MLLEPYWVKEKKKKMLFSSCSAFTVLETDYLSGFLSKKDKYFWDRKILLTALCWMISQNLVSFLYAKYFIFNKIKTSSMMKIKTVYQANIKNS